MSDEDDYMSDAFLKDLEDVRPGLLSKEAKRKKVREKANLLALQSLRFAGAGESRLHSAQGQEG